MDVVQAARAGCYAAGDDEKERLHSLRQLRLQCCDERHLMIVWQLAIACQAGTLVALC